MITPLDGIGTVGSVDRGPLSRQTANGNKNLFCVNSLQLIQIPGAFAQ